MRFVCNDCKTEVNYGLPDESGCLKCSSTNIVNSNDSDRAWLSWYNSKAQRDARRTPNMADVRELKKWVR